jgi:hypothetical protein
MDSLCDHIDTSVNSLKLTIHLQTTIFCRTILKKLQYGGKNQLNKEDIMSLWNDTSHDFMSHLKYRSSSDVGKKLNDNRDDKECHHIYEKGAKKGIKCDLVFSKKSISKKYCVKHYKQNENNKEDKEGKNNKQKEKEKRKECIYIIIKGKNEGNNCEKKASKKSIYGDYCLKHSRLKELKECSPKSEIHNRDELDRQQDIHPQKKIINKLYLLKFINELIYDITDKKDEIQTNDMIRQVVSEFGLDTIYNMKTLIPYMYIEIKDYVEGYIKTISNSKKKE